MVSLPNDGPVIIPTDVAPVPKMNPACVPLGHQLDHAAQNDGVTMVTAKPTVPARACFILIDRAWESSLHGAFLRILVEHNGRIDIALAE